MISYAIISGSDYKIFELFSPLFAPPENQGGGVVIPLSLPLFPFYMFFLYFQTVK